MTTQNEISRAYIAEFDNLRNARNRLSDAHRNYEDAIKNDIGVAHAKKLLALAELDLEAAETLWLMVDMPE